MDVLISIGSMDQLEESVGSASDWSTCLDINDYKKEISIIWLLILLWRYVLKNLREISSHGRENEFCILGWYGNDNYEGEKILIDE